MKDAIHPVYRDVVYQDVSSGFAFLTRSTAQTKDVTQFEGKEYPVVKVEISSASHPFYTGQEKMMDTQGRVERFNRKYGKAKA